MKKITVEYTADPATSWLTARAISDDFNLNAVVTQAPTLDMLKERASAAIDLVLELEGHSERYKDTDVVFNYLPPADFER